MKKGRSKDRTRCFGIDNVFNNTKLNKFNIINKITWFVLVGWLVGWLVGFLWHINLCRLLNAKSIFIQIISSVTNNSV